MPVNVGIRNSTAGGDCAKILVQEFKDQIVTWKGNNDASNEKDQIGVFICDFIGGRFAGLQPARAVWQLFFGRGKGWGRVRVEQGSRDHQLGFDL